MEVHNSYDVAASVVVPRDDEDGPYSSCEDLMKNFPQNHFY